MRELILGGARSGKSTLAEGRARGSGLEVVYIATADAGDDEMAARIERHRERRPDCWTTIDAPHSLAATLMDAARADRFVLVDCLTLWLGNLIEDAVALERERQALIDCLPGLPGDIVLVTNEVGLGIVPVHVLGRRFRDEAGWLNQTVASVCERVTFVAAGLPLCMKDTNPGPA